MLSRYKNDNRICYICSENYGIRYGEASYFFSKYGGSWGWATWKRVYNLWEYKLDTLESVVSTNSFISSFPTYFQYLFWKNNFYHWKYVGGNTYDLQTKYLLHKHDMINIIPNTNLTTNIGWDNEASNTLVFKHKTLSAIKFGNIKSFDIEFIMHPTEIKIDPDIEIKWFKYHFQNKSEFEYRIRWILGPLFRKLIFLKKRN
jgi:hypothetical protein